MPFPALRARTNIGADSLGLHHYRFGSCDAATDADAQRQYATLSNCCDALVEALDAAAAGGGLELPHDALHAFRTKLEEHLCYWRPPPRPKQKAPGRPRGVGSHGRTTLPERNRLKAQQPGARAGRWTAEEHAEFLRLHASHGRKWTLIAEEMPFRTEPQIRSHAQKHYLRVHQKEAQAAAESAAAALGVSLPAPGERRRRPPPPMIEGPDPQRRRLAPVPPPVPLPAPGEPIRVRTAGGRVATVLERRHRGWFVVELDSNSNAEGGAHERKSLRRPQFAKGQDDILNMLPIRAAPVPPVRGTQLTPPAPAAGPAPVEPTAPPAPAPWPTPVELTTPPVPAPAPWAAPPAAPTPAVPPVVAAAVPPAPPTSTTVPPVVVAAAEAPATIADYVTAAVPAPSNVPPVVAPAPPPPAPVPTMVPEPAALPSPEQPPPAGV